jgi:hypothetical protein
MIFDDRADVMSSGSFAASGNKTLAPASELLVFSSSRRLPRSIYCTMADASSTRIPHLIDHPYQHLPSGTGICSKATQKREDTRSRR